MELDELIKELDKKLIVTSKEIIDGIIYIYCETEKQIKDTHVDVSNNTILRIIKKQK